MSGFEVAGVVLGSIPLIISALEHYSDGVSTIKSMQKYESVFDYLHASFVTGLAIYRNSLEELLSPLALPDAQLYQLLEEVSETAWEDDQLVLGLRKRLSHNYLPFKSSVKQLNKKIILFGQKLQLGQDLKPIWVSASGSVDVQARESYFRNPLNRMRGGFRSDKYKQLLATLQEDIDRIATLTAGAIALEPLRLDRRRKANAECWNRFRSYAERLYESFNSRWSTQCTCQCPHEANLRLEMRSGQQMDCVANYKLLFSFDNTLATSQMPWDWRAVEIEPSSDTCHIIPSTSTAPTIQVHAVSALKRSWSRCDKVAPKIVDLCEALKAGPQKACCVGILDDSAIAHHIHTTNLPNARQTLQQRVTLQQILDNQNRAGFQIKEKCSLALTLATAVLQLHDTPWLGNTWNMNDIILLGQTPDSQVSDQPYISRSFSSPSIPSSQGKRSRIVKNATVFALGVALLEISYGKQLKTFETADDRDEQNKRTAHTDYLIADRLVENIHMRELPNYANAARRCVHCNFDGTVYSLEDDDFRERFYQGVIVPLQQDYNYATVPLGTV